MGKRIFFSLSILVSLGWAWAGYMSKGQPLPRVIVITDLNQTENATGDKQSLAHLFMYADMIEIAGIIPANWEGDGYNATIETWKAYKADYNNPAFRFRQKGYPEPDLLKTKIAASSNDALATIINEANKKDKRPLYILAWGNMNPVTAAFKKDPSIAENVRLISVGTNLASPKDAQCIDNGIYGKCRNELFNNTKFTNTWWIEIDWSYNGMLVGNEPKEILNKVSRYGALGKYTREVAEQNNSNEYFRAGKTPSLLYLLDPYNNVDDPTRGSWAGKFTKPFPKERPNYYAGTNGGHLWNYKEPCATWANAEKVYNAQVKTVLDRRPQVYNEWIKKLNEVYN
ncbi:MAG: nucleoside hydrolase-like domain-containing protein [Cyclobacteriaceae bacterium]